MDQQQTQAIRRLVAYHGGPTAVSRRLGGYPVYQEVQRWVSRGWASPKHFLLLEPLLLEGMTLRDLFADMPERALLPPLAAPAPAETATEGR